ncbi:cytochrome P450 [Streptomyces lasalocidi]
MDRGDHRDAARRGEAGEEIDLVDRIAMTVPISVIGDLLGVPRSGHGDLREWNRLLTGVDTGPAEKYQAYMASLEYIKSLVADKRAHAGRDDDLITALLELDGDDVFTDAEILSTVFLVMNAGYETTANLISSGVYALLDHPDQQQLLRERPELIPGAVEEFLRYEAPLNLSTLRCTAEAVTVGDTTIPAGELVFIALGSANRDPERFPEPDRLDVTRAASGHVAFGHGIHHCVGAPLARMEGEIVLGALLRRFPRWRAAAPLDELAWRYSLQFRGLERLPVLLDRTAD